MLHKAEEILAQDTELRPVSQDQAKPTRKGQCLEVVGRRNS